MNFPELKDTTPSLCTLCMRTNKENLRACVRKATDEFASLD